MTSTLTIDFDGAWKETLERYFNPFLLFCFPEVHRQIDWSKGYAFLDKELQEVVRDAQLGKQRVDKLVRVVLLDGREEWILIHVEIQTQVDGTIPLRVYQYHHRVEDRFGKPVLTLVVLADEQKDWRPCFYQQELLGCRTRFEFPICKLSDFGEDMWVFENASNPVAVVIGAHLSAQRTRKNHEERLGIRWRMLRNLYERGWSREEIIELHRLLDWLLVLPPKMNLEFRRRVLEYEKEKIMPYITSNEQIATEEGRQEGRQEGRLEGRQAVILRQLRRRLGGLENATERRVCDLGAENLELLAEDLLDFTSVSDLNQWLDRNQA